MNNRDLSIDDSIAAELVKLKGLKRQYLEASDSDLSQTRKDFILNEIAECKAELLRLRTLKAHEKEYVYKENTKRIIEYCAVAVAMLAILHTYVKSELNK